MVDKGGGRDALFNDNHIEEMKNVGHPGVPPGGSLRGEFPFTEDLSGVPSHLSDQAGQLRGGMRGDKAAAGGVGGGGEGDEHLDVHSDPELAAFLKHLATGDEEGGAHKLTNGAGAAGPPPPPPPPLTDQPRNALPLEPPSHFTRAHADVEKKN